MGRPRCSRHRIVVLRSNTGEFANSFHASKRLVFAANVIVDTERTPRIWRFRNPAAPMIGGNSYLKPKPAPRATEVAGLIRTVL